MLTIILLDYLMKIIKLIYLKIFNSLYINIIFLIILNKNAIINKQKHYS